MNSNVILLLLLLLQQILLSYSINNTSSSPSSTSLLSSCTLYNEDGKVRPYRVVVSVDFRLLEVFMNWLIYYYDACRNFEHLDIICLDTKVQKDINRIGLKCNAKSFFSEGQGKTVIQQGNKTENRLPVMSLKGTLWNYNKKPKDALKLQSMDKLGSLWARRIEIISEYVSSNIDVILSDTDAIWLKDPLPDINKYITSADVIASRAIYPTNQHLKWGSTLCMGFLYLKSGIQFVDEFFQEVGKTIMIDKYPDDQKSLNELLDINNITWPNKMSLDRNDLDMGNILWSNTNTSHGIVLLPHDTYIRKCHQETMARGSTQTARQQASDNLNLAKVAHCRTPKGQGFAKAHRLKAYKIWRLKHGWRQYLNNYFRDTKMMKKDKKYISGMMKSLMI